MLNLTTDNILVTWKSFWDYYYIEVSSNKLFKNFTTYGAMIKLNISDTVQKMEIFECPNSSSEFTIGMIVIMIIPL